MAIKLEGLETDLKINTKQWDVGIKTALAGAATLAAAVTGLVVGFKKLVDATFDWAREMDEIQDVTGATNKEAAALNFVLRKSGTETDKLTKGMVILEKGLIEVDGSLGMTGKKLEAFGISVRDVNGNAKTQADLLREISDKYNSLGTQQERVNFLTEVFGKSGADLIDVFDTLAAEGGIDKVTEKVEKLGLAIDPAKYEEFQRNLEEVKLAGLGLAVTIVDNLMPTLRGINQWWTDKGLPAFQSMAGWLNQNVPIAAKNAESAFASMEVTLNTRVSPTLRELIRLYENTNAIMERLDPSTEKVAGKFTMLGTVQRIAVAWATIVNGLFLGVERTLSSLNAQLERAILLWDAFWRGYSMGGTNGGASSATAFGTTPKKKGRATGGAVIAGQTYNVLELGKAEMFTPNTSGRIDPMKSQPVEAYINEALLGRIIGAELAKALG